MIKKSSTSNALRGADLIKELLRRYIPDDYSPGDLEGRITPDDLWNYFKNSPGNTEDLIALGQKLNMYTGWKPRQSILAIRRGDAKTEISMSLFYDGTLPELYFSDLSDSLWNIKEPKDSSELLVFALSNMKNDNAGEGFKVISRHLTYPLLGRDISSEIFDHLGYFENIFSVIGQTRHTTIPLINAMTRRNNNSSLFARNMLELYFTEEGGLTQETADRFIGALSSPNSGELEDMLSYNYDSKLFVTAFNKLRKGHEKEEDLRYGKILRIMKNHAREHGRDIAGMLWNNYMHSDMSDEASKRMLPIFGYLDKKTLTEEFGKRRFKISNLSYAAKRMRNLYDVYPQLSKYMN